MKKLSLLFVVALTTLSFSNSHCMDKRSRNDQNTTRILAEIGATVAVAAGAYGIYSLYNYYSSNNSAETKNQLTPLDVAKTHPRKRTIADYAADAQSREMKQALFSQLASQKETANTLPRQPLNDETQVAKASALIGEDNATKTPVTQNPTTPTAILKQEPVKQFSNTQVQPSFLDTLSNSKPVKFLKEKYGHFRG